MTENNHTLNQLPKDWKWVKLGEVVNVLDNLRKPINSSERQRRISGKSQEELFPYFGATGQVGWIDGFLTDGKYVLVGEDGAPFLDIFKEKAYKIKGKTWVNNHAHILKELSGVTINDFILHYLNSINYRHYVNGTTRLKLTKGNLVEIPFPLPSINTQQAIVSKIEELFSEIENGIKSLFAAQQQLKTYRQSVLKWAFEGKLTNSLNGEKSLNYDLYDLPEEHDLSIAAKPETEYKVEKNHNNQKNQKNHGSDKGDLPEGWQTVILKDLCKIVGGVTKGRDFKGKETIHLPYLRVANVQDGYLDLNEIKTIEVLPSNQEKYKLLFGDILYTEGGDKDKLGRGTIWKNEIEDCIHQNHIFRARPLSKEVDSKYIAYFSQTKSAKNYFFKHGKQTTNLASINLTILSNLPLPLCSLKEQNKIVHEIENRLSVADKMEESINQSLQQAEALKQSILKKAFEGRLV